MTEHPLEDFLFHAAVVLGSPLAWSVAPRAEPERDDHDEIGGEG